MMPARAVMVATSRMRSSPLNFALRQGRLLAVLLTVGIYSALAPFGYAGLALLCALWRRHPQKRARRLQTITSRAYRLMHDWLTWTRITSFDWRKAAVDLPSGPCVVIANHPTLIDVTAITAALGGAISIVKPGLYRRAMIRPLLLGLGHVEGPGADPIRAGKVVDRVAERLSWGIPVVIFPEGTRSPPGGRHAFGRVAFEVACRAQVPLVVLGVTCEPLYLSKQAPPLRPPHPMPRLEVQTLAVERPGAGTSSRTLRAKVESLYDVWLNRVATHKPKT